MPNNPFNDLILVPELVIEKVITQSLIFLRQDYDYQVTTYGKEELSWLYLLCNGVGVQRVNFFTQAKKLFLVEPDDPKRINVYLQFPEDIKGAVAICINHSGEQHGQNVLGVGEDESFLEQTVFAIGDEEPLQSNAWRNTYSRRYNATYQIICTGDNTNEVIILYTILKSLFLSLEGTSHWNALGFANIKISGADIQIKQEITKKMFAKVISLAFEYEFRVPDIRRQEFINGAIFNAIIKEE